MTGPRRVRTQAERDADGHAWRAVADSRPGYATWPHTRAGSPSWWGRDLIGVRTADGRVYAPEDVQLVYPDPDIWVTTEPLAEAADAVGRVLGEHLPAIGEALTELLAPRRRRWWHRLTRRAL